MKAYTSTAKIFHWSMAILILGMLPLGGLIADKDLIASLGLDRMFWVTAHKSVGMSLLVLLAVRIGWRILHKPPELPSDLPYWQKKSAHLLHCALYSLMVLVPMSGWAMTSASPYPLTFFNLLDLPKLSFLVSLQDEIKKQWMGTFAESHEVLTTLIALCVAGHIAAALFHQFVRKDIVMRQMLPTCAGGIRN